MIKCSLYLILLIPTIAYDPNLVPGLLGLPLATVPIADVNDDFVAVELPAKLVTAWLRKPTTNFGLALLPNLVDDIRVQFDSKENGNTSHALELEVVLAGPVGPVGPQGEPGLEGPAGADGAQGSQGIQGPIGPQGPIGLQGPQGVPGTTGADGTPGSDGVDGSKWFTGNGPPPTTFPNLGTQGDFYLDSVTGDFYEKFDTDNDWRLQGKLEGRRRGRKGYKVLSGRLAQMDQQEQMVVRGHRVQLAQPETMVHKVRRGHQVLLAHKDQQVLPGPLVLRADWSPKPSCSKPSLVQPFRIRFM